MFRFLDHTGDFAIEAEAETPEAALGETVAALVALVVGDDVPLRELESRPLSLDALDAPDLLVALGNEVLYFFETERFLPARLLVDRFDGSHLEGSFLGQRLPHDHPIARPAKAVTHHDATFDVLPHLTRTRLVIDL